MPMQYCTTLAMIPELGRRHRTVLARAREARNVGEQLGDDTNTADALASMFAACGKHTGNVAEAPRRHWICGLNLTTRNLKVSLFFSPLAVAMVSDGGVAKRYLESRNHQNRHRVLELTAV